MTEKSKQKICILIYPNNNIDIISATPPLGILYLASFLRNKGIYTEVFDLQENNENREKLLIKIVNKNPYIVGFSCNIANFQNAIKYASFIKKVDRDIKIIFGGPIATSNPEIFLKYEFINCVCKGEGEITLYEYYLNGKNAKGLYFLKNNEIIFTGNRNYVINLDSLPFPALDLIDLKKYHMGFQKDKPLSGIITSRGCPYQCIFCYHGVFGYQWRERSPKNVYNEIEWQVNELGVNEICFWDDNFTLDIKRTEKICDLIKKNNLKFLWQCTNGIRTDKVSIKTLSMMRKNGCWNVGIAPESGDQDIVYKMKKNLDLKQVKKVRSWCKQLNIFVGLYLIMGLPFETAESRKKTHNFVKEIKPDYISAHVFTPFSGTKIVDEFDLSPTFDHVYKTGTIDKEIINSFRLLNLNFFSNPRNIVNIISKVGLRYSFDTFLHSIKGFLNLKNKN